MSELAGRVFYSSTHSCGRTDMRADGFRKMYGNTDFRKELTRPGVGGWMSEQRGHQGGSGLTAHFTTTITL